jgi:hypothetical protein
MTYDFSKWGAAPQSPMLMDSINAGTNAVMGVNTYDPGNMVAPIATGDWKDSFLKSGSGIPNIGANGVPGMTTPNMGSNWWDGMVGTKESPGWGGMAMGAASGIASAYMGMQQYGLARDTLNQHKAEYAANYDAQKRTTNASLEDRQRARVASNAGAYQSVGAYMAQNGIK